MVCGIPSLVTAAALLFLPESPRYLLSQGQEQEALQVLRRIFSVNTGQPESLFPVGLSLEIATLVREVAGSVKKMKQ